MPKLFLFITILSFSNAAYNQFSIEPKVRFEFDSLFNAQPKIVQKIKDMEGFENGFALLLEKKEDTLNMNDFSPMKNDIKIYSVDEDGNVIGDEMQDTFKYNQFLFISAAFVNDSLEIASFIGPFSGYGIYLKLIGDKTFGNFMEYEDKSNIYRKELSEPKSPEVRVKANIKNVGLSQMPNNAGDIFYGKVTLTTQPFYVEDTNFKNGYIFISNIPSFIYSLANCLMCKRNGDSY